MNRAAGLGVLVFFASCATALAQTSSTPAPVSAGSTKQTADSYSKEPYVFESISNAVRFEADGTGQRDFTFRARIQSESAVREFGLLTYPFAARFETVDIMYVRVKKADGATVETPPSDVQEIDSAVSREAPMYTDSREKHIAVKALGVGDVLEAHVHWTVHDPIAPGHFWFDYSYFKGGICLDEKLDIDVPANVAVKVRNSDPQPLVHENAGRRVYAFATANPSRPDETNKIPDWEKNSHGAPLPDVEISSFASWAEIGAWYGSLQVSKVAVTPDVKAKSEDLTKGKSSDDEKVHALYDFVSTRFRYIGIDLGMGRYTPHAASEVLVNRYGDCKDKHTLFAALLQAAGISSYPALVSSKLKIDASFPTPSVFDHVITAIPRGDSLLFLDTTPEVAPFGLLMATIRDRQVLVIPSSAPARLVTTPADPVISNYEHAQIDASIDTDGTLDAKMRFEDRGDGELALRLAYRGTPQNRWQELTQAIMAGMGFAGTVSDVSVVSPEDTSKPFWMSFSYRRTDFPDWKNHRIVLPSPPILIPDLNEAQKRSKDPLPLGALQDVVYESTIKLPDGYSPVVPGNVDEKRDFAEYSATYAAQESSLHGTLRFKTFLHEVPGSERGQFSDLAKTIDETVRRYIFLAGPLMAGGTNGPALLGLMPSHPEDAIPALEKMVADNPENKAALISLSEAYSKTGRAKDGIPILEKGIASDPEDSDDLQLALAKAYLAVPDAEKALQHFQEYLGDQPTSSELNEVAYALGDAKVRLPEALAFSRRAVDTLSKDTMDIDPGHADHGDFALMEELAANWDTLGWIEFRSGDFASAEKFLEAAWELAQDPVIGEHLVETYEKTGKSSKAAVVCNMTESLLNSVMVSPDAKLRDSVAQKMKRLRPLLGSARQSSFFGTHSTQGQVALVDMRSVEVTLPVKLKTDSANATFVLSFTNGEKPASAYFVSGSNELREAAKSLASAKYFQTFPTERRARIIRKLSLNCSRYSSTCTVLISTIGQAANRPGLNFIPMPPPQQHGRLGSTGGNFNAPFFVSRFGQRERFQVSARLASALSEASAKMPARKRS